MLIEDF